MSYLKLFLVACFCLLGGMFAPASALAQYAPFDLNGYAWSSNIGWISLNCLTGSGTGTSVCGTSDYKVSVASNGAVSGYAWSSNVGWIKFGGLSGWPSGGGTTGSDATVSGDPDNLTMRGWARACKGTLGGNCSSMTNSDLTDNWGGWDGWIALNGTSHSVRIDSTSDMITSSYAWGGTMIGYIDMWSYVDLVLPTVTLTGSGCAIPIGASTCSNASVTWELPAGTRVPDVYNSTRSEVVNIGLSGTDTSVTLNYGGNTIQSRSDSSVVRSITLNGTCAGNWVGGVCTAIVGPAPVVSISSQPPLVRGNRTNAVVSWVVTPDPMALPGDIACLVQGPGITPATGYSTNVSGSLSIGSQHIKSQSTYRINCSGSYGTVGATTTVEVISEGGEA